MPKKLFSRDMAPALVFTAAVLLVAVLGTGCACTKPDCNFRITSPTEGQKLPPGDVDVAMTPYRGDFCNFPARSYELKLDDGAAMPATPGDAPHARFANVGPGTHTATGNALDSRGRVLATSRVTFVIEAPAAPVPTPVPTPPPAVAPETPAPVAPDIEEMNQRGYLKDVFFDFDKDDIRPDQRDALSADADWLKKNPNVKITIEGHCDERGTRQYNMALGERRAHSAKEYLVSLGVDAGRMQTISYGKDRPFDSGHDEAAWAKNRRAHFVITSK
jgi:peptidoglycan-associated lipoprotein